MSGFDLTQNNNHNWLRAIAINIVFFVVITLFSDFIYESNDDYAISVRFSDGYEYIGFVNVFLCRTLIKLQGVFDGINVFIVFQLICSFICFVYLIKTVLDINCEKWIKVLFLLILTVYMADHYCSIQFTKTSAILLIAGVMILVDAVVNKKNCAVFIISFVFIYLGSFLRFANIYVAGAFAFVYAVFWVWSNRTKIKNNGYFTKKRVAIYCLSAVLFAGVFVLQSMSAEANRETEALDEYRTYNSYRAAVVDYPVFEDYELQPDGYEEIGISGNDLFLISKWYLDYDGAASEENLQKIREIYDSHNTGTTKSVVTAVVNFVKDTGSKILRMHQRGVHIILLIVVAALGFVYFRPRHFMYILGIGCMAVLLYLYLHYSGRPIYRATYGIDLAAMVWIMYYWDYAYIKERHAEKKYVLPKTVIVALFAVTLLMQIPIYSSYSEKINTIEGGLIPQELTEYLQENTDVLHVFPSGAKGKHVDYLSPLKEPEDTIGNTIGFGSWGTKSPYAMEKLYNNGMTNVFKDVIDNENVLVVENKNKDSMESYFNKWYGTDDIGIKYEHVRTVGETAIWKVVSYEK